MKTEINYIELPSTYIKIISWRYCYTKKRLVDLLGEHFSDYAESGNSCYYAIDNYIQINNPHHYDVHKMYPGAIFSFREFDDIIVSMRTAAIRYKEIKEIHTFKKTIRI